MSQSNLARDKSDQSEASSQFENQFKKEVVLEYGESIIGGLPVDYRLIGDEPEYDEVPLIESLSWFDYNVELKGIDFNRNGVKGLKGFSN